MKRLLGMMLALVLCLTLAACGAPDRQPAQDAVNVIAVAYNEIADVVNEDSSAFADEDIAYLSDLATALFDRQEALRAEEITGEELDAILAWCEEVAPEVDAIRAEYGIE